MRLSEEILAHVVKNHIEPAKRAEHKRLTMRAGDIHGELGYTRRVPAICSVLGSNRLQARTNIQLIDRKGPHNGANARFTLNLERPTLNAALA